MRRGARLNDAEQKRLSDINQQLAALFSDFRAKVLDDENTWTVLDREADLAGLPDSLVSAAKAAAGERGLTGKWVIVNTRSSVDPFLTSSTRRDLREKVWKKFKNRGDNGDQNDTKATIAGIVKLRAERAKLLDFPSHAHWRMSDTMALEPKAAQALMMRVWPAAVARVKEEVADMQAIAAREGAGITIEPWDYLFYAEKVRKAQYDLDQAQLKPYFELNNMVAAALWSAEQRYDIRFTEITGKVPVFHPDVRVFEVTDVPSGTASGTVLSRQLRPGRQAVRRVGDQLSRRSTSSTHGATAITSNNNNFVKASAGEPVLISLDDATTLFHEFGHALHSLLQDITYPGLATTPRDFVGYPSQVNEHWLLTREVLDKYARHYKTGQPMPQALVDRIRESEKFNQGYATVEYLAAAILDMELHTRPDGAVESPRSSAISSHESACPARLPCGTGCRTSITCSAAMRIRRAITATCGRTSWPPTPGRRSWRRVPGTRRSRRACARISCRTATRPIGPRLIASSAAAIPTSRRCSPSADFLQGSSVARPPFWQVATRLVRARAGG